MALAARSGKLFILLLLSLAAAGFLSSGCAKLKERKYLVGDLFEVKPPQPDTVTLAVLPVQNATFHPVRITGRQTAISEFLENFLSRSLHFKYNENDIAYVQKTLQLILTQRLYNSGFRVLTPQEVYAVFSGLGLEKSDTGLNIEEITPSIAADWLLLVTLTEWEGDRFELKGRGKAGYQAVLVDTRLRRSVWEKTEKSFAFYAPYKHLPYNRQAGDALNVIARRILKNFPKPEKIIDYKQRAQGGEQKAESARPPSTVT